MIDYSILPEHMREGMKRYIEEGVEPGSFLYYILCNDLMAAAGHADEINKHSLWNYCNFLYNYAPYPCHGSKERVKIWMEHKGLKEG